jgi:hypothetical protein
MYLGTDYSEFLPSPPSVRVRAGVAGWGVTGTWGTLGGEGDGFQASGLGEEEEEEEMCLPREAQVLKSNSALLDKALECF